MVLNLDNSNFFFFSSSLVRSLVKQLKFVCKSIIDDKVWRVFKRQ